MRAYKLDTEAARDADSGTRITETGAYTGKITLAKEVIAKTKTQGVQLTFESELGQEARFLTLWTHNASDETIYGYKQLNALMTCLRVRELTGEKAAIEEYDFDVKKVIPTEATIFRELMGKPIGLVLQKEFRTKDDGKEIEQMNYFTCFDSASRMMASEILEKADSAQQLDKLLKTLNDKDSRKAPTSANDAQTSADFDDDIPF